MSIKRINLDNNNELIIHTQNETFSGKYGRKVYCKSSSEIILRKCEQLLCVGICSSNTYTGEEEYIQYTPQCILFFRGNSIKKSYYLGQVFDIKMMQSLSLTKDEVLEKYNIELSEKIKDSIVQKKYLKQKHVKQYN